MPMSIDRMQRVLLLAMSVGLVPIALSYGVAPGSSLPWLFGIDASGTNTRQIFRAIMGLYLGMIVLWAVGALRPSMRRPALCSLLAFTSGLALGRLLSLVLDGFPHPLLFAYMLAEFALAGASWFLLTTKPET